MSCAGSKPVQIVPGSDAGVAEVPHDHLIDELLLYRDLGMPAAEVLRIGIGERPSGWVVLDADPLADLGALRRVSSVVVG